MLSDNVLKTSGRRVELVPFGEEHVDATFDWLTTNALLRAQIDCLAAPTSRNENRIYWNRRGEVPNYQDFAIINAGKHVGNCGLSSIDIARSKAQLWIYLALATGSGVGTEALHTLLSHAFESLKLQKVYLRVLASNPSALRFYERLGFQHEGLFHRDTIHNGVSINAFALAIYAEEYSSKSGNENNRSPRFGIATPL